MAALPGLGLAFGVTALALGAETLQEGLLGVRYVDGLVLAILAGTLIHTLFGLNMRFAAGLQFASKTVLEVAVVLLGGTISAAALAQAGIELIAAVAVVVLLALTASYLVGRWLGLDDRLATLVACGNSICGNSAIMAMAPVIEAPAEDVAASIAFTAALGIVVVLLLPLAFGALGLTQWQYGVVAGLSVYAVPQVLAATGPVGVMSTQVGTLVKLMRVLMLGPVVLFVGLRHGRQGVVRFSLLVPWFIVGFMLAMAARSFGLLPEPTLQPLQQASSCLTLISMAALGLSVDLRTVLSSGGRVLAAGFISILVLMGLAVATALLLQAA
ncbi:MAG: putative sulfate exporter family transporter [Hyphomicrobiales bacterium]|nr:MAG: putative sulfate exporter family transporter [Hyphomicrobiales bacterium]